MRTDRMQRFECNFLISIGLTLLLVAATIVLSSTAKAAERVGGSLGEFVEAGEHGGRPYFMQRDTEGSADIFLYNYAGNWLVGVTLGGSGANLMNYQDTPLPPTNQWLFVERGTWNGDDTSLTLEFTALSPCQLVRVEGEGDVVGEQGNSMGDYR